MNVVVTQWDLLLPYGLDVCLTLYTTATQKVYIQRCSENVALSEVLTPISPLSLVVGVSGGVSIT